MERLQAAPLTERPPGGNLVALPEDGAVIESYSRDPMVAAITFLVVILIVIGVAAAMIFSGPKEQPGKDGDDSGKA